MGASAPLNRTYPPILQRFPKEIASLVRNLGFWQRESLQAFSDELPRPGNLSEVQHA